MFLNRIRAMTTRVAKDGKNSMLGSIQKRNYQYYGGKGYNSGFERMILDKFEATRVLYHIPWFAVLGGLNLAAYGLSTMMSEEDYKYYFAYRGDGSVI